MPKKSGSPENASCLTTVASILFAIIFTASIYFVVTGIHWLSDKFGGKTAANDMMQHYYKVAAVVADKRGRYTQLGYEIQGRGYSYTVKGGAKLEIGEWYEARVSTMDPNYAIVYFARPVIDTLRFKFLVTQPIDIDKGFWSKDWLAFSYQVNGVEYKREQKYDKGKRPENVTRLKVKYRADRAEIGYLVE